MTDLHVRKIIVQPSWFFPEIKIEIGVPNNKNDKEYIDKFLKELLDQEFKLNVEWTFVD